MKTIKIHVWKGMVDKVEGIPEGYNYEVVDADIKEG